MLDPKPRSEIVDAALVIDRRSFRQSQRLRCATTTRMAISWTISISLWTVLALPFAPSCNHFSIDGQRQTT